MSESNDDFKNIFNDITNQLKELNRVKDEISRNISNQVSKIGTQIKDNISSKISELNKVKDEVSSKIKESTNTVKESLKNDISKEIDKFKEAKTLFKSEFEKGKQKANGSEVQGEVTSNGGTGKPNESKDTSSAANTIKNIGLGTLITSAMTSLLSAEALQEPLSNLGTAVKSLFESILGGSGEDNPLSSITSVIADGINLVIEMIGYLSPVAETIGSFLSMGFSLASQAVDVLCESLSSAMEYISANKEELMFLTAALAILAIGIGAHILMLNLSTIATNLAAVAVNLYTSAMRIYNAVMTFATGGIGKMTFVLMGVVAVIYMVVKNWDTLKQVGLNACKFLLEGVKGLASGILNFFSPILNPILDTFNLILKGISNAFNFITGLFDKVLKPNIKMPRLEITGKFSLNPPQVPKFGIGWYQTGGIFTGPSVIGVGENGDEAVLPLSNKRRMKPFANAVASMMGADNSNKTSNQGVTINIDNMAVRNDMDIKKIAEELNRLTLRENRKLGLI